MHNTVYKDYYFKYWWTATYSNMFAVVLLFADLYMHLKFEDWLLLKFTMITVLIHTDQLHNMIASIQT